MVLTVESNDVPVVTEIFNDSVIPTALFLEALVLKVDYNDAPVLPEIFIVTISRLNSTVWRRLVLTVEFEPVLLQTLLFERQNH